MANGYGDYINDQYKKVKKPKTYKTTGSQYNKTEVKERAAIRSQLANDVAYWQQKRGVKDDRQKDHVAIAENYYKTEARREEVEKAGQKRMSANKGKGSYSQADRLTDFTEQRDKDRKTSSKAYEKEIGKFATSDFKKQNNYGVKGLVESDVRFRSYMDKKNGKKNTVAQQLVPEFGVKKKEKKNPLDTLLNLSKDISKGKHTPASKKTIERMANSRIGSQGAGQDMGTKETRFMAQGLNAYTAGLPKEDMIKKIRENPQDKELIAKYEKMYGGEKKGTDLLAQLIGYGAGGLIGGAAVRGTALGAKGIGMLLKKGLTKESAKQIAKQTAKEGATVGGLMAGTEVGVREGINPDNYNWKGNAGLIGLGVGAGAVADPLIALAKPAFKTVSENAVKNALRPSQKSFTDLAPLIKGTPKMDLLPVPTNRKMNFDDVDTREVPFTGGVQNARQAIAATSAPTERPSLDMLMRAFKGQDVPNVSQGPTRTASDFTNQLDDMQAMNADVFNPDGTINLKRLKAWQTANTRKQKKNNPEVAANSSVIANPARSTDSVLDTPAAKIKDADAVKERNYTEDVDILSVKNISGFNAATNDMYRNFEHAFGKDSPITKRVLGELDKSKVKYVDMQERLLNELHEVVVKGLGITKGSKLSRYVQDFGEKNMDLPTLMEKAPNDWEKVVDADKWFKQMYKKTLNEINTARALAYPGDKSKLVPEREDYYRHYQELSGWSGLKNMFDTPSQINPQLAGTSEFTRPGSRYASFMQRRGLGPYKSDAVGGFLNYVPSAAYATHIDANIKTLRNLKDELADMSVDSKHINGTVEYLHDLANDFAGKTNPHLDRWVQKVIPGGRGTMGAVTWLNNRVKTNTILGNLGSALAQVANVPNGLAFNKQHSVKGVGRAMKGVMDKSEPIHQSPFLRERYSSQMYRQFDTKMLDQPKNMAAWLIETADRVGTSFVWNSTYEKGLSKGVPNPIQYADENTRKLIAGRGVGEVPLLQKSKIVQTIIPFTLEVGNAWRVMFDLVKGKDAAGIAILFTASHVLNNLTEELRGSPVMFDPYDALKDAIKDDLSPVETGGRLAGEVLSNVPGGQYISGAYPEYGEIGGFKLPTRDKMFGDRNPRRFGTGLVLNNGVTDPLFKVLPPFGGNQLKKSLGGLETYLNGGSYNEGKGLTSGFPFQGEKNELKFPVEQNKENLVKSLLFGQYSTKEAREYFNNDRTPLGDKQTARYKQADAMGRGEEYYDMLMDTRRGNSVKRKIKAINEDKELSAKERQESIQKVLKLLELK